MSKPPITPGMPLSEVFTMKMHAPMKEWAKEHGGAEYVRQLIRDDRKKKLRG